MGTAAQKKTGLVICNNLLIAALLVAAAFTGILGNLVAPMLVKLFQVKDSVAVGLGIGTCGHAMGLRGLITAIVALNFQFLI